MAETPLPSLYRIDRDMGEIAWVEEKDSALDDVERAIRMGVLVPVNREAIDQWFLICKQHGARQLTDPALVDRCNVWWWMNEADSARTSDEPPCVFVDAALGEV